MMKFKVIEVPPPAPPVPPGIKREIKKIMDKYHMKDKEKHYLLISMANDIADTIKWDNGRKQLFYDVETLKAKVKRYALYEKIFIFIIFLFIVRWIVSISGN